jgi:type II secretory pathway pseudopilin PulG
MAHNCEPSGSLPAAASPSSRTRRDSEGGFTLVEVIVAAMILVVGLLSLAQLLVVTIRAESLARNGAEATRLAQGQLDALMKVPFADPQLAIIGSDPLTANVANHCRAPVAPCAALPTTTNRAVVRWRVAPGPGGATRTRLVTVRVLMAQGSTTMRMVDVSSLLRQW